MSVDDPSLSAQNVTACAQIVERGDADRFLAVMAAPVEMRARLWPIYAFNVEVARAPWVTEEAGIAEIRVQWWRDALEEIAAGGAVRRHEVVAPLAAVVRAAGVDVGLLDAVCDARRWDIYREPFEDAEDLAGHLRSIGGGLMQAACQAAGGLGRDGDGGGGSSPTLRAAADVGYGGSVAAWLMAVPALEARGRVPLVDGTRDGVAALARDGLAALDGVRDVDFGGCVPVVRAAWRARGVLRQAVRDPGAVADGRLGGSEFGRRAGLAWTALRGRW